MINVAYLCVSLYIEYTMNYNKWMNEKKNHLKPGNVQFSTSYLEKLLKLIDATCRKAMEYIYVKFS